MKKFMGLIPVATMACSLSPASAMTLPDPTQDIPLVQSTGTAPQPQASIVVAGGCFWGIQAVFQHVKGVTSAISGYAGGAANTAHYEIVSGGATGHAESVQVTYDPSQVTLGQLLKVFFAVAHNPTELNYQGPDHGTQYRSAIFYATPVQKNIAETYIKQLDETQVFPVPIVTKLEPLDKFYPAEDYHQNYARLHPDNGYIVMNDLPKVTALEQTFPQLYVKP